RMLGHADLLYGAKHLFCLSTHVEQILRSQGLGAKGQGLTRLWHPLLGIVSGVPAVQPTVRPKILYFGRLLPYKGLDLLADALKILGEARTFELRVCGSGPNGPALDLIAAMPGGGITVERRWFAEEELPSLLAWSDALVLPYREASQSGVAALALEAGRCILATRVGGLPEQLEGQPGVIFCAPNAPALAQGLQDLTRSLSISSPACVPTPDWNMMAAAIISAVGGEVDDGADRYARGSDDPFVAKQG
ncbi:MAG: glycosyltransferase family 4 protein, partial [Gammaproteobacteria bacterium]|nr:glycosyltransferase family 4 protein [Gammaproteobacteria bacterium]